MEIESSSIKNSNVQPVGSVFVSGLFNILHPGHFRFLKFASNLGQKLIVGIIADKDASPKGLLSEGERLQNISDLSFVSEAFILDKDVTEYLKIIKPNVVVKGWEHHDQNNPEKEILATYGGRLIFSSGEIKFSEFEISPSKSELRTISKNSGYENRHSFNANAMMQTIESFSKLNVCVVGDLIVDKYLTCQPVGMSREDPTIVVRPAREQVFMGGAGIVACHAASLGAQVSFISVCGDDDAGIYCQSKLKDAGVRGHIWIDETRPTTQKTRYRADTKTLLRVNDYSDHPIAEEICNRILETINNQVNDLDLIIFSDFSYGVLPQDLITRITNLANKNDITVTADSQCSSQVGDISRFKNISLVTPTEHEARTALGKNTADGLVKLSEKIHKKTSADHVVITLGSEGLFISTKDHTKEIPFLSDRLPAFQSNPVDPAGAGDALLVTSSLCLASGASIWEAIYIGSLASALQVSRVGNVPLSRAEMYQVLNF